MARRAVLGGLATVVVRGCWRGRRGRGRGGHVHGGEGAELRLRVSMQEGEGGRGRERRTDSLSETLRTEEGEAMMSSGVARPRSE